jgi:hypothetical protein
MYQSLKTIWSQQLQTAGRYAEALGISDMDKEALRFYLETGKLNP